MGHFCGNGVDKYLNTGHVCLDVTGTIMMKNYDPNEKYMHRWAYFQFSGMNGTLVNYCLNVSRSAKVAPIIELQNYRRVTMKNTLSLKLRLLGAKS